MRSNREVIDYEITTIELHPIGTSKSYTHLEFVAVDYFDGPSTMTYNVYRSADPDNGIREFFAEGIPNYDTARRVASRVHRRGMYAMQAHNPTA